MADAFQPKFVDLVRNVTTTTGTANFTLGPAASGFTSFAAACAVGDQFYYSAVGIDRPGEREVGRGTLLAGNIVSRDPIGGVKTNFSNGSKSVALIAASEWYSQAQQLVAGVSPFGKALTASADAASARDSLGIGSAALESASRFAATLADRAALGAYSATSTAFLREPGREGLFVWDATDQSALVAADGAQGMRVAPSGGDGSGGAWVRRFSGPVDPRWFGVSTGNSGAANSAAMLAMFAALRALLGNSGIYQLGVPPILFPAGTFDFASTIDLTNGQWHIEGANRLGNGTTGTVLQFPAGVTGIRVQRSNTVGATGTQVDVGGADNSIIKNLVVRGSFSGTESEAHGIHLRASAICENVLAYNFEGDGFYIGASAPNGNANVFRLERCAGQLCRNGCAIGADSLTADVNAGLTTGCDFSSNRRWGLMELSFLGNTHIGLHTAANGLVSGSSPPCRVSHGGNVYAVIKNQGAGASTNAPSGTTADNTWWAYVGPGGPVAGDKPAWASGTTYRDGGSIRADGGGNAGNVFIGCYSEFGQGWAQIDAPAFVTGKSMLGQVRGVAVVTGAGGGIYASGSLTLDNMVSAYGWQHNFGPTGGASNNLIMYLDSTGSTSTLLGRQWVAGSPIQLGYLSFSAFGVRYDTLNPGWAHTFKINGTDTAAVQASGLNLMAGKSLSVAGTHVVAARKTGWALDTGTAKRSANATYSGTAESSYTQATVQALMDAVRDVSQTVKALKDDLHASAGHGLIG